MITDQQPVVAVSAEGKRTCCSGTSPWATPHPIQSLPSDMSVAAQSGAASGKLHPSDQHRTELMLELKRGQSMSQSTKPRGSACGRCQCAAEAVRKGHCCHQRQGRRGKTFVVIWRPPWPSIGLSVLVLDADLGLANLDVVLNLCPRSPCTTCSRARPSCPTRSSRHRAASRCCWRARAWCGILAPDAGGA